MLCFVNVLYLSMASITPTILQNNQRKDGSWIVVFRLSHKRKSVYIKTSHSITKSLLNKDNSIKQKFIIDYLSDDVKDLQDKISRLGLKAESYTAQQLKDIITADQNEINFLKYAEQFMEEISLKLKKSTVGTYRSALNHLKDYVGGDVLLTRDITSKFVKGFIEFMQQPREIIRYSGADKKQRMILKSQINSGNALYTMYFRFLKMFESCKDHFNDEDLGIIRIVNNPFKKVDAPKMEITKKRSLSVEDIRRIRDYQPTIWSEMVGKNIFMLSFYMCGINIVDIKENMLNVSDRLNYNRSKVKNKRMDKAFISVKVPKDAKPYVEWYISVKDNWINSKNLVLTTNKGLKRIASKLNIEESISTYYARHSFATIARNDCRVHKEDIAMALNHSSGNSITDIYIRPDWSIIDEVQDKVINKINEDLK